MAPDQPMHMAGTAWDFPTSGSGWIRSTTTGTRTFTDGTREAIDDKTYDYETYSLSDAPGLSVQVVRTDSESYNPSGDQVGTGWHLTGIATNGVIYVHSDANPPTWEAFLPARVVAGDRWRKEISSEWLGQAIWDYSVIATTATSPNGYTDCIHLRGSLVGGKPGAAPAFITVYSLKTSGDIYIKPGVGMVWSSSTDDLDATIFGTRMREQTSGIDERISARLGV